MIVRDGCLVIPLVEDFDICGDYFLLDCEGEGVTILILIRILILAVPLHFF